MREEPLSTVERDFIHAALREGRRADGRGVADARTLRISLGPAPGSAEVQLGPTRVLASARAELVAPAPERPAEGVFSLAVDLSPAASAAFCCADAASASAAAASGDVDIARVVERGVRQARALDVEGLCVVAGRRVWAVRVDVHVLDACGNAVDAASLATAAALLRCRRPQCAELGVLGEEPLVLHHVPVSTTFALFPGDAWALDPTAREELAAAGALTVTANKHREVCGVHKTSAPGAGAAAAADPQTLLRLVDIAVERAAVLTDALFAAIAAAEKS